MFLLLREESALPVPSALELDIDDLRRVVLVFEDFPPLLFFILRGMLLTHMIRDAISWRTKECLSEP